MLHTLLAQVARHQSGRPFRLLQIEPALECNLACVMCPWAEIRPGQGVMAWSTFARLAPDLPRARGVDLTGGGEPLANPRLPDMVDAAKAAGCEVGFSTNGTLLYPSLAKALVAAGLDWIGFSVDAATAASYERIRLGADFGTVAAHIQGLVEAKRAGHGARPRVLLIFVMMRENFGELPAYIDLAAQWGVNQVIVKHLDVIVKEGDDDRRVFDRGAGLEESVDAALAEAQRRAARRHLALRVYRSQPEELAVCEPDPLHGLFVNWAGDVSPCITLAYAGSRVFAGQRHTVPCLQFGNVNTQPVSRIWEEPAYHQFRQAFSSRVSWQQRAALDVMLGAAGVEPDTLPPAPLPCRTCYYLYGV